MGKYKTLGPDAEVVGGVMNGFIAAINSDNIKPHLEKLGMTNLDPAAWYPKQMHIDLFNSIAEASHSAMFDFVSIGMTIAEFAWPSELDGESFEYILSLWPDTFNHSNRGADRGYIRPKKIADKHYAIVHHTPDPDDLNYGVVYGTGKRFLPKGTYFSVFYDKDVPRMEEGGNETIIHIQWE